MIRIIFGAVVAAIAMFVIGFIFFGPLGLVGLATSSVGDVEAASVQQTLAANLPRTGTYFVPAAEASAAQTVMFGRGPIATIHYNTGGFAAMDPATMLVGLVFNFVIAMIMGLALLGIDSRVADLGSRARVASILAVAGVAFSHLSEPIYYKHDWPYFIYVFVADSLMLIAAGIILAWFLPRAPGAAAPVPEEAPTEV
jgi:hypothetical protein